MPYMTLCQRGHHEYFLGMSVETKERCIYCGEHRLIAAIKAFFKKVVA